MVLVSIARFIVVVDKLGVRLLMAIVDGFTFNFVLFCGVPPSSAGNDSFVHTLPLSRHPLHGGSRSFLPRDEHHFFTCLHCTQLAIAFGGLTTIFPLPPNP